jgi:hypothetical protein
MSHKGMGDIRIFKKNGELFPYALWRKIVRFAPVIPVVQASRLSSFPVVFEF